MCRLQEIDEVGYKEENGEGEDMARKGVRRGAAVAAGVLAVVFLVAAVGKLFFPEPMPQPWDSMSRMVAVFELVFALVVLRYYARSMAWAAVCVVMGGWSGFALYWLFVKLPCGCMGKMLDLPSGMTFAFDLIFFALSLNLMKRLGRFYTWGLIGAGIAGIVGYVIAGVVFERVTAM